MNGEDPSRAPSRASSVVSMSLGRGGSVGQRRYGNERIFVLEEVKALVLEKVHQKRRVQRRFHEFFNSSLFDELVKTLLIYFISKLEYMALENGRLKGQEQGKMEAIQQAMGNKSLPQLELEMKTKLEELCPLYAKVLMKYSDYSNLVTDKVFFETLYDALSLTVQLSLEVPNSLSYKKEIEVDLGQIFRTQYFNTWAREEERNKLVDTLTIRDLYKLRHETDQTTMNAKMVSALYERPRTNHMHESYCKKSDMVSYLLARANSPERNQSSVRFSPPRGANRLAEQTSDLTAKAAVRNALGLPQEDGPRVLLLGFHEVNQLEVVYRSICGLSSNRRQSVNQNKAAVIRAMTQRFASPSRIFGTSMNDKLGIGTSFRDRDSGVEDLKE